MMKKPRNMSSILESIVMNYDILLQVVYEAIRDDYLNPKEKAGEIVAAIRDEMENTQTVFYQP